MVFRSAKPCRSGYTLLEVLLSSAIGVMLLGALYLGMDLQLRHAQAGRDVVESSSLARTLLDRISIDISLSLAPTPPQNTSSPSQSTDASAASNASSATSTGAMGTSSSPATASIDSTGQVTFNQGVQGDTNQVTVYVSRWPREAILSPSDPNFANPPLVSDLRRVTWFMSSSGLARQELLVATSDDALNAPAPDLNDGFSKLVAREVKSMTLRYYDAASQTWQDSWDGTQPGADGVTPMGPPAAVEITMDIAMPNPDGGGDLPTKTYVNVIALQAANGLAATASGANSFNPNASTTSSGTQP